MNLPITDNWALRFAYVTQKHDGYAAFQGVPQAAINLGLNTAAYVTGGTHYYAEDRKSYRISSLWQPVDNFTWYVVFENYVDTGGPVVPLMQNPRPGQQLWSILAQFQPWNDRTANNIASNMDCTVRGDAGYPETCALIHRHVFR